MQADVKRIVQTRKERYVLVHAKAARRRPSRCVKGLRIPSANMKCTRCTYPLTTGGSQHGLRHGRVLVRRRRKARGGGRGGGEAGSCRRNTECRLASNHIDQQHQPEEDGLERHDVDLADFFIQKIYIYILSKKKGRELAYTVASERCFVDNQLVGRF